MNEIDIQDFWNHNPCGDYQVGGLASRQGNYESFFNDYDRFRYEQHSHLLKCLDDIQFEGKTVLEVGLGQGADSEQIIRRGGIWSGLDLTPESVSRVKTRLVMRNLPYEHIKEGTVLDIPYEDNSFDVLFSHGVLHHVPEILTAQREIHRVLKPGGELVIMMYAKWSLNYLFSIAIARRLGLAFLYLTKQEKEGKIGEHLVNARKEGLLPYLRMKNFIHRNTDGPMNPYSKVYDLKAIEKDFPDFEITKSYKRFMHAPPLKVNKLPLEKALGWHLWVHLKKR